MKLIMFVGEESNQSNLVKEISSIQKIDLVVLRKNTAQKKNYLNDLLSTLRKSFFFPLNRAWFKMLEAYPPINLADYSKEIITVQSVNEEIVFSKVNEIKPTLTLVSGTNLLSNELISLLRNYGDVFNLHTGLSPYVNGGPNCTNWCLFMNKIDLIGNTVMHINSGIDSGDLIATEKVDLNNIFTLKKLHQEVMHSAQKLYLKCIHAKLNGIELPSINQENINVSKRTFYTKEWNIRKEMLACKNFYFWIIKKVITKKNKKSESDETVTFPLNIN